MEDLDHKQKRCIVVAQYLNYGSGLGIVSQVEQLCHLGFQVQLILSRESRTHFHSQALMSRVVGFGVRIHFVESTFSRTPWCAQGLERKLRSLDAHESFNITHGGFAASVLKRVGLPFVHVCHGFGLGRPEWIESQDRIGINGATAILAVSADIERQLFARGIDPNKTETVYYPLNIENKGRVPSPEIKKLAMVANLVELKGHKYAVRALHLLRDQKKLKSLELHFFGEGPLEDELRSLSRDLGIEEAVKFHGYQQMEEFYPQLDLILVPSLVEGLGMSIAEAFCWSLPVVAFDSGGISELVENNRTGKLVTPEDVESFSLAIASYCENQGVALKHSRSGFRRSQELFSPVRFREVVLRLSSS